MKKTKKVLIYLLTAVLAGSLSFGSTYAYLYASDAAVNEFTIGGTITEVEEDYDPPPKLTPGAIITKKPWIVNKGNLKSFVRALIVFSDLAGKDICEPLVIGNKWHLNPADGYYYYQELLAPGASTQPLFETVEIKSGLTEEDMKEFEIIVYAESRQVNDGETAADYISVWQ